MISGAWGTLRLVIDRSSIKVDEDVWGFGQILAVFLLIGPLVALVTPLLKIIRPKKAVMPSENRSWVSLHTQGTQEAQRNPESPDTLMNETVLEPSASDSLIETSTRRDIPSSGIVGDPEPNRHGERCFAREGFELPLWNSSTESVQNRAYISETNPAFPQVDAKKNAGYPLQHLVLSHLSDHGLSTPGQVKNRLDNYFTSCRWIRRVVLLTACQLLVLSVGYVYFEVSIDSLVGLLSFIALPMMLFGPSSSCFYYVALGLGLREDHFIKKDILSFPALFWIISSLQIFEIIFFAPPCASVAQIGIIIILSLYLLIYFCCQRIGRRVWLHRD